MPGGYDWSHVDTLKMIDLYYNSKYKSGAFDSLGLKKFFYNVVKPACDVATKFIDLDTKDVTLIPELPDDEFRVWIMQRKLNQYMKDAGFDALFNEISIALPKYGSVVLKKDKHRKWNMVNIQNLRFNPTVKSLNDSEFVYELATMSRSQIKDMNWNEKEVTELFKRGYDQSFTIYMCYDKTEKGWTYTVYADLFTKKKGQSGMNRSVESEINNKESSYYGALKLYEGEVKELPYRELHWERVPGRWLGYGFVEYLEENQIAENEAENLERKALIYASLQLWQSRDENVAGQNVLANAQNGDIVKIESEITKIDVTDRNLGGYSNTRGNWSRNTERKTFTTNITTGADLPSRTPLGVANLQASLATSYFEIKRENFGIFIKNLVVDDIIPDFEKDTDPKHILSFLSSDEEIEKLDQLIIKRHLDDAVLDYALKHGYFPSVAERDRVKREMTNKIRENRNRYLEIPRGWYRNAKYIVKVNVTGESIDNGARSQVMQLALQIMNTNPAILQNPSTKKIFFSILSMGGVNPIDLGLTDMPTESQPQMPGQPAMGQGGSVALPQANPGVGATNATY